MLLNTAWQVFLWHMQFSNTAQHLHAPCFKMFYSFIVHTYNIMPVEVAFTKLLNPPQTWHKSQLKIEWLNGSFTLLPQIYVKALNMQMFLIWKMLLHKISWQKLCATGLLFWPSVRSAVCSLTSSCSIWYRVWFMCM